LTKEITECVLYSKTAREIWLEHEEIFGQNNGAQVYHMQKEISEYVQGFLDIVGYSPSSKGFGMIFVTTQFHHRQ